MQEFSPVSGRYNETRKDLTGLSGDHVTKGPLDCSGSKASFIEVKSEESSNLEWRGVELHENEHLDEIEEERGVDGVEGEPEEYGMDSSPDVIHDEKSINNGIENQITAVWISISLGSSLLGFSGGASNIQNHQSILKLILHYIKVWLRLILVVLCVVFIILSVNYLVWRK